MGWALELRLAMRQQERERVLEPPLTYWLVQGPVSAPPRASSLPQQEHLLAARPECRVRRGQPSSLVASWRKRQDHSLLGLVQSQFPVL